MQLTFGDTQGLGKCKQTGARFSFTRWTRLLQQ